MKKTGMTIGDPGLVLRLGGGICFLAHGLLALSGKVGFLGLLGSFGLESMEAANLLKLIGCLDVLVGLLILFRPSKRVLQWATFWTALTIVAWGIHGDGLLDLARRATYVTTPLALLLWMQRSKSAVLRDEEEPTASPQPSEHSVETGLAAIESLDLRMICRKLMDETEGEGWTKRQCAEVAGEYRRYLALNLLYPSEQIVPNIAIDTMWHYHILDTAAYYKDCMAIFGRMLHHYPYFGMHGMEDEGEFINAFDQTKLLYAQTFDNSMDDPDYLASFKVRRSA